MTFKLRSAFAQKRWGLPYGDTARHHRRQKRSLPKAVKELKGAGDLATSCELRQSKYLNHLVEQDHRFIKRLVKPGTGFFSFETAWRTLQGYEGINRMRKGQMQALSKGDSLRQAAFIAALFEVVI